MKKILQAFKNLFRKGNRVSKKPVYICDPRKAINCSKQSCWEINRGPCKCTHQKKQAKVDANGDPILAQDEDQYNLEWLEQFAVMKGLNDMRHS